MRTIATIRPRFWSVALVADSRAIATSWRRRTSRQRTCCSPWPIWLVRKSRASARARADSICRRLATLEEPNVEPHRCCVCVSPFFLGRLSSRRDASSAGRRCWGRAILLKQWNQRAVVADCLGERQALNGTATPADASLGILCERLIFGPFRTQSVENRVIALVAFIRQQVEPG